MTKYRLEFFRKRSRRPYMTEDAELPNGMRPRFTNTMEAFNYRIEKSGAYKVVIRYRSNGGIVGETYRDTNGTGRIRWFKG